MVPNRLRPISIRVALFVVVAALWTIPGNALPLRDPGPFYPLVVGHAGEAYSDRLPTGASYSLRFSSFAYAERGA